MKVTATFEFRPFNTRDNYFYVYLGDMLIAAVVKVGDSWRPFGAWAATDLYPDPVTAAMVDANLSVPEHWHMRTA